ncbi:integrator complex subunit-like protein isoform X2 [Wolffia australiana]
MPMAGMKKCFRKRPSSEDDESDTAAASGDEEERRFALEEVKLLQKHRERRSGIPALPTSSSSADGDVGNGGAAYDPLKGGLMKVGPRPGASLGDGEKDDLVLQDTFAQETAVTVEDPNMVKYVEQELAKQRGKNVNGEAVQLAESELKRLEDELYAVPDHLKLKRKNPEESSTQWTTGIAEVQLPIEYKLRNIEETEAAKKLLQEKTLMASRAKLDLHIPSSYSADYSQRGKDYAEKLRRVIFIAIGKTGHGFVIHVSA